MSTTSYGKTAMKPVDAFWAEIEGRRKARAEMLQDEQACLNAAFDCWERLKELGWRDIIYCPKDGTVFLSISAGSTGIHECYYEGEWPDGSWWLLDDGDLWPAHPMMWKPKPCEAKPSPERSEGTNTSSPTHGQDSERPTPYTRIP